MVKGINFADQLMTSANMGHFMWTFLNHENGVSKGCEMTHSDTYAFVGAGYFFASGRMLQIEGTENIQLPEVQSGQLYCALVFEVDLSKTNTAEEFNQGAFKILSSSDRYPSYTQEDLDDTGTVYQMPFATFIKTTTSVISWADVRRVIDLSDLWNGRHEARLVTLPASGWSASKPYTQTLSMPDIHPTTNGFFSVDATSSIYTGTDATGRATIKAEVGYIDEVTTAEGSVTFTCRDSKPSRNLPIALQEV